MSRVGHTLTCPLCASFLDGVSCLQISVNANILNFPASWCSSGRAWISNGIRFQALHASTCKHCTHSFWWIQWLLYASASLRIMVALLQEAAWQPLVHDDDVWWRFPVIDIAFHELMGLWIIVVCFEEPGDSVFRDPAFSIDETQSGDYWQVGAITTFLKEWMKRFISGCLVPLGKLLNHLLQLCLIAS